MNRFEDQAICVRVWEWSETSQVVCILTHQHGLIRGLAKGSRRDRAPFSGGFEVLTLGDAGVITKPSRELAILTHWDLRWTLPEARRDLNVFHAGLYAVDLAGRLVQDQDPHPGLFRALRTCLEDLPTSVTPALLRFQWAALTDTGHRPEIMRNVSSDDSLPDSTILGFDPRLGGCVSDPGKQAPSGSGVWRVRAATIHTLRNLTSSDNLSLPDARRASKLLHAYTCYVLGRPLASGEPLFGRFTSR